MATNFSVKIGEIGRIQLYSSPCMAFGNGLRYRHCDLKRFIYAIIWLHRAHIW